jgi:aldehyde dehydrogenase (NAD+)/betaine-aldehyde dehydrogenase
VVLGELAQQVYPAGVVNVICGGREAGAAMVDHDIPEMVSITGSTRAGAQVMSAAAKTLKDVHLELGGKAPAVVFADVDIRRTASEIALAAFFNAGQDCTAVTRVLVHQDIHAEFAAALADAAAALKIGGHDADLGPLNSAAQLERVEGFMSRLPANARVLAGGKRTGTGFYFEPTVIDGVFQSDEVVRDEIFGPVLTVQPFTTEDEAIELANGTKYALASSVWSENHGVVTRVSNELDFGSVWINCHGVLPVEAPHGGFKHSGTGKDLSVFGLEDYTRIKSVNTSHR